MEASEAEEPVAPTDFFGDEEEEAVPSSFDLALEKSLPIFFGIFAAVLFCCCSVVVVVVVVEIVVIK